MPAPAPVTVTFEYTGALVAWVVPALTTSLTIECWGASADVLTIASGGKGGYAKGTLAVTPGETLYFSAGQAADGSARPDGPNFGGGGYGYYGGGGGASDVRQGGNALANRKIVAGGGGGQGYYSTTTDGKGGDGGGLTGSAGLANHGVSGGGGATQSAGGSGRTTGALGQGGAGDETDFNIGASTLAGGGGGGGYYGGGGGDSAVNFSLYYGGGGGGGSSYVGGVTSTTTTPGVRTGNGRIVITYTPNVAPNAPTLTGPVGAVTINRANTNRFSWAFSDDNPGDTQSKYELRYRVVGAPSWTTVIDPTPNAYRDFAGGTFTAGNYEWQVRTYDALGTVGPWSASEFFTAADAPAGPTITAPVNGSTISLATGTLTWSTPDQDAYQVRKVADAAGVPDTATVYYDTGEVTDALTRSAALTFPVNNRTEHLQVRIKNSGLWSPWTSVSVDVSYSPPPAPTFTMSVDPATASLLVTITNPAPGVGAPLAAYNDIYVDDGDGEERKVTQHATNAPWRYMTPRSGRDYAASVRVVAVANNGTTASSS